MGAAVFPALIVILQLRSGWPPLQWSGYSFWMPERYGELSSTFGLYFALQPDTTFRQEVQGRPISHLELAVRVLLGIPGLGKRHYLGLLWPILGWLAAIPLYRAARRRWETAPWVALALLLWTVGHVVVFSLYFYPASRFYLGPLALCLVLLACGLGVFLETTRWKIPAAMAAALVLLLTARTFNELRSEPPPTSLHRERTRASFNRWLRMGDEKRTRRTLPFDPVHAQALGLLTPEVAARVRSWGELPDTVHVRRLRANGTLDQRPGVPARASMPGRGCGPGTNQGCTRIPAEAAMTVLDVPTAVHQVEPLTIAGRTFRSRLFLGTGKYPDFQTMAAAHEASGTEVVTVALRRVNLSEMGSGASLLDFIDQKKYLLLPNTAGCYTADEAIRTARLARELGGWNWVKLEVIGDQKTLFPDNVELLKATETLVAEGFVVLPYTNDDPVICRKLEELGAAAVMPLGAPIGSGMGIRNPANLRIILEQAKVPVIVDAGVGTASDAAIAMELGAHGVLLNTAVAEARDPVRMARAMKLAVEAGWLAANAGRIPRKLYASASSPLTGLIE